MSHFNCLTQELNFKMSKWHSWSTSDPLQVLTNKLLKEMKLFDLAERWKNLGLTGEKNKFFTERWFSGYLAGVGDSWNPEIIESPLDYSIFSFRYPEIAEHKIPKGAKRISKSERLGNNWQAGNKLEQDLFRTVLSRLRYAFTIVYMIYCIYTYIV